MVWIEGDRSNNASERAVKQMVIGRKNWLFAVVPSRAEASALICTMVEMARANGVNVYQYLTYLLEKCPSSQVERPKALGDIHGVSYIYGFFRRFGLIKC